MVGMAEALRRSQTVLTSKVGADVESPTTGSGKTVDIRGKLLSSHDFVFAGKLKGAIECEGDLTLLQSSEIEADIRAQSVTMLGKAIGRVSVSDKLEIRNGASLVGDVECGRIIIEDGAYFKGSINIVGLQKTHSLAIVGSPEASRLDNLAEDEIARGVYEDLDEADLFGKHLHPRSVSVVARTGRR
jgi:cytoskeletal protein CcmA (bactofilin family)